MKCKLSTNKKIKCENDAEDGKELCKQCQSKIDSVLSWPTGYENVSSNNSKD